MGKKSARAPELREKSTELSCMWGFFASRKMISDGRRSGNKPVIEHPRKHGQLASFDEECRKLRSEPDLASVTVDARQQKTKQAIVKAQQKSSMTNSELLNLLLETHKRAKKNTQNAKPDIHQSPSNLGSRRSTRVSKEDKINMKQIQMSAKALTDQMFIEGKHICKEGPSSGSRSFSEALDALSTSKDLWRNIDRYSETSVAAKPNDKIVLLKPIPRNSNCCENIACHCPERLSTGASDGKTARFPFEEIKMKLEQTFRGNRKEPNHSFLDYVPDELSQNRDECTCHVVDAKNAFNLTKKNLYREREYKSKGESGIFTCTTETVRKKLDFSRAGGFSKKQEFDVILEAKRHLSERLNHKLNAGEDTSSKKSPKTLRRILLSPEHDLQPLSTKRDSIYHSSGSAHMRCSSSPCNSSPVFMERGFQVQNEGKEALQSEKEVLLRDHFDKHDSPLKILDIRTDDTEYAKSNGQLKIVETNETELYAQETYCETNNTDATGSVQSPEAEGFGSEKEDEDTTFSLHLLRFELLGSNTILLSQHDSLAEENEKFTSPVDDLLSTPSSIQQLDMSDSNKHHAEHQSPVSVLDPFFTEEANSPPSSTSTTRTAGQSLRPLSLNFQEQSNDPPTSVDSCTEDQEYYISQEDQDYIFNYVHSVLQASRLNWDNLSEITLPAKEDQLLDASLFDEFIESLPTYCYFDPKLLFDHINEVILGIYKSHVCLPPWLAFAKPRIRSVPLEELVFDEVMNEAEFYLLPRADRRTLDQLVSKDVAHCRQWLDVRSDTEQIVIDLSEDLLDVSILDVLIELHL